MKIREKALDWVLRLMIVVSLVASVLAYTSQHSIANCTADWAGRFTTVIVSRGKANTARLDSLNKLLVDALSRPPGPTNKDLSDLLVGLSHDDDAAVAIAANRYMLDLKAERADPQISADVKNYLLTERMYFENVKSHPFPDPPTEVCK